MAKKKETKTVAGIEPATELTTFEKMDIYFKYSGLRLDKNCPMDKLFAEGWYDKYIVTGIRNKWTMHPQAAVADYKAGIIYKSYNITDEIAERLMQEFPESVDKFINLEN